MSWWTLVTLIISVEFLNIDGLYLEELVLDVDLVIVESLSSSTSSLLTTCYHLMVSKSKSYDGKDVKGEGTK